MTDRVTMTQVFEKLEKLQLEYTASIIVAEGKQDFSEAARSRVKLATLAEVKKQLITLL